MFIRKRSSRTKKNSQEYKEKSKNDKIHKISADRCKLVPLLHTYNVQQCDE